MFFLALISRNPRSLPTQLRVRHTCNPFSYMGRVVFLERWAHQAWRRTLVVGSCPPWGCPLASCYHSVQIANCSYSTVLLINNWYQPSLSEGSYDKPQFNQLACQLVGLTFFWRCHLKVCYTRERIYIYHNHKHNIGEGNYSWTPYEEGRILSWLFVIILITFTTL